jgi:hypothetical protein
MEDFESNEDVFERANGGAVTCDHSVVKQIDVGTVCKDCGLELVDYYPGSKSLLTFFCFS